MREAWLSNRFCPSVSRLSSVRRIKLNFCHIDPHKPSKGSQAIANSKKLLYVYLTEVKALRLGCFSSYFLLFVTFGPTSSTSQYACCCIYGKRSLYFCWTKRCISLDPVYWRCRLLVAEWAAAKFQPKLKPASHVHMVCQIPAPRCVYSPECCVYSSDHGGMGSPFGAGCRQAEVCRSLSSARWAHMAGASVYTCHGWEGSPFGACCRHWEPFKGGCSSN